MLLFSITVSSSFILITSSVILSTHKLSIISLHLLNVNYLFNSHEWPRQNFSLQYQYNINQILQMMRIKKNINLGTINWSNTKFSELTLKELYGGQKGKLQIWPGS